MKVLLVDDDPAVRDALAQTLELADLKAVPTGSYIEAKDHIAADFDGIIVSDIRMPGKDGFDLLEYAHQVDSDLPVVLLTGEGDVPTAVRGISSGAFDFLEKPCAPKQFLTIVEKALRTRELVLENRRLKRQLEKGDAAERLLHGKSQLAEGLRARVRTVAKSSAEVLITGAPGSGTAKIAEVIHLLSAASMRPFKKLAAASATPESLQAAFEIAEGGTIFLDEVAALAAPAQYALLELLDNPTGQRVLAGTYRDLGKLVDEGSFNADLYYKLEVMRVRIPSLKERPEDIPVLFRHYVDIACEQAALPVPEITPEVISRLMSQDWPGNARSLMNAAMRFAMGLSETETTTDLGLADQMAQVERSLLIDALQRHHGHASDAARALKLPRKTFYDKLTKHSIRAEDYR